MIYTFGNKKYDFESRTFIMAIMNITPDSFSDGNKYYFRGKLNMDKILDDAIRMELEGADFIDVGGESTRPGSEPVPLSQELDRVIPVISKISKHIKIPVSIDTYKHEVADEALKAGARIVNDISGFNFDDKMPETAAKHKASCILMHIKGTPKEMQKDPVYENVIYEIKDYLKKAIEKAKSAGVEQIIIDPGIGFGKTFEHNIEIIKNLKEFKTLGYPLLIGLSRKSFISKIYESTTSERTEGTIVSNAVAVINGANILRVHDVLENRRAAITARKFK
jgi:dihydropteroate synthase